VQQKSDADFKTAIEKGVKNDKGMMPGYGSKLTPEQIDELVKYVRSLKK
jgi:mono/diheme cytochrome c family protein